MGSFIGKQEQLEDLEENIKAINYDYLKTYSKYELINHIKSITPKNINLTDDFTAKLKDMEIDNTELIPMCIELYDKILIQFGVFKNDNTKKSLIAKKMFFVKPKFDADAVKKNFEIVVKSVAYEFDKSLENTGLNITIQMKNSDITVEEFSESFNNNITKKDMMGMSKKILSLMPTYLKTRFINTFNKILKDNKLIKNISWGKCSYIYKAAKKGSTADINSFRQIISIPNVVNQFHRLLCLRLNTFMHTNKIIDTNIQKGGISGQNFPIFEQFYKLKNVLKFANKNKQSCAVLFLDITNAFGSLNLENLYNVLELYHVDKNFINYIREYYSNFEYYVDTAGIKTDPFKWKDGLIQGCALSPLLFITALNYVLTSVDRDYKVEHGFKLTDTINILLTAFIDDICIICKDLKSLEVTYKRLALMLEMMGLQINKGKCALIIINDDQEIPDSLKEFKKVDTFKYLGEYVSSDGSYSESYTQFLKMLYRKLMSIDVKKCENKDKCSIFQQSVVPWIQRKTLAMYDIGLNNRLKIASLIKPYIEKWEGTADVNIFSNINGILEDSIDCIISNVTFDNECFDKELEQNIEISNYVLKNANVKLQYGNIDDDFELDLELDAQLEELGEA
jgi:hypothetical protein